MVDLAGQYADEEDDNTDSADDGDGGGDVASTGGSGVGPLTQLSRVSMRVPDPTPNPTTERMRKVAYRLLGGDDPEEMVGSMDKNASMQLDTINGAIEKIRKAKENSETGIDMPLLHAAAGMLSPTRSGGFGESLGNSVGAFSKSKDAEDKQDFTQASREAGLEMQKATLQGQTQQRRMTLGQQLLTKAESEDTKRAMAEFRAGLTSGKTIVKTVPGVGLVEYDPEKRATRILVGSPDPHNDPKYLRNLQVLAERYTHGMEFDTPEQKKEYTDSLVQHWRQTSKGGGTPNIAPPVTPATTSAAPPGSTPAPGAPSRPAGAPPVAPAAAAATPIAVPPGIPASGDAPRPTPGMPGAPLPGAPRPVAQPTSGTIYQPPSGTYTPPVTPYAPPEAVRRAKGPTIKRPEDEAYAKASSMERGKDDEKWVTAADTEAGVAAGNMSTVQQVRALDAKTGRLEPAKAWLGQWAAALGIEKTLPKNWNKAAVDVPSFNAVAMQVVLDKQIEQKGVQTEGDAVRMRQTFASITNPEEANDFIMRAYNAQAQRMLDKQAFAQQYRTYPGMDGQVKGVQTAWSNFIREMPLVIKDRNDKPMFVNEFMDLWKQHNPNDENWWQHAHDAWITEGKRQGVK